MTTNSTKTVLFVGSKNQRLKTGKKMSKKTYIKSGRYRRYDGVLIYVLEVALNTDTGDELVLYHFENNAQRICAVSVASFLGQVEQDGKLVDKYKLDLWIPKRQSKVTLLRYGEYKKKNAPKEYAYQKTYPDYAKYILTNFADYDKKIRLSRERKQLVGLLREDYETISEDHKFLTACVKTALYKYKDFIEGCVVWGKSIREYASEKNIGRGRVEYQRKRLIYAFALLLEQRDTADGVKRIR
jgi:hypothetical protein